MYKDNVASKAYDHDVLSIQQEIADSHNVKMVGEITDKIYKNGKLVQTITDHNLVVTKFLSLAMALLKGEEDFTGISYWAVGSGSSSWDSSLPDPELNATQLTNEIGRVAIADSEITYLNADYTPASAPTNILQIKHTFNTTDCNGSWREFGLFGGNASATINSGYLINKKHHQVITKTSDMTIERTMRFTLNLV